MLIGIAMLVITILAWALIRNRPDEMGWHRISDETAAMPKVRMALAEGVKAVLSEKFIWPIVIRFLCSYGVVIGFGGLWGGLFLMEIYGLTKAQAVNVLLMIPLGIIIGSPFLGWLSDRVFVTRKPIIVGSALIHFLVWGLLAFWTEKLNEPLLYLLSFMIGIFGFGASMVILAATKELFPKEIAGTSLGLMNIVPFVGAAIIPPLMGYIMDKVGRISGAYPMIAYKEAFGFCFVLAGITFLAVCFMKETLRKELP